jgi:hypothetical protein
MLASGLGHKPAFSLQPHNFVCRYLGAYANRRSSGCRFPSGRPGGYALRPSLQSTRKPLPLLNHQTPIPPPLRGLLSLKTCFYKVSKTYALPLPPKPLQGPAKIWVLNAPARPVFLAYVRLKSNCTDFVARTNPPGSPLQSQCLYVAAGPSAFKHYVPPGVGSYINNGSCSFRFRP